MRRKNDKNVLMGQIDAGLPNQKSPGVPSMPASGELSRGPTATHYEPLRRSARCPAVSLLATQLS
jgi:hypothetical protein